MANITAYRFLLPNFLSSSIGRARRSCIYGLHPRLLPPAVSARALSSSSLHNSSPPPKEINLKHWLVLYDRVRGYSYSREELIENYLFALTYSLKRFSSSEEDAKKMIYSISTSYYYGFGALLTEEFANELKSFADKNECIIKNVIPDPFVYEGKREYQGEPFINGEAAPYDPKYHEAWVRIYGEEDLELRQEMIEIMQENAEESEKNLKEGCDFEHWLVWMRPPQRLLSREEIIDNYIKTLAHVVGSEEEAKMKIYKVSTRGSYKFGALLDYNTSEKLLNIPGVRGTCPDFYEDIEKKDYGGEPFINGKAVP